MHSPHTLVPVAFGALLAFACSSSSTAHDPAPPVGVSDEAPDEAPERASAESYERLCPVLASQEPIGGTGPSLVGNGVSSDLAGMQASLPETIGPRHRERVSEIPRGMAGHASPQVLGFYAGQGGDVGVEVVDLVHVCRHEPGTGLALREREAAAAGSERREIGGQPALLMHDGADSELRVWVNDRCLARIWSDDAEAVSGVAAAIDWARLVTACE